MGDIGYGSGGIRGGVGGISQVYLGMAFRFFDRLSLGVNDYLEFMAKLWGENSITSNPP